MNKYTRILTLSALIAITGFSSCKKDKKGPDTKTFDIGLFKAKLQSGITYSASTQPRGYSFVISKDGNWADTASVGSASYSAAGGSFNPMHVNQEINVASVTKTITGVAVLQLLKKRNISIKTSIGTWLPAYWNAKQVIKDLTFEQLMTHSSGLTETSASYDTLRAVAARGLDDPAKTKNVYANINFGIFRAIIPYLSDAAGAKAKEATMVPGNTAGFETWLSQEYLKYTQANIFDPIGLNNVNCIPSPNSAMLFSESTGVGLASVPNAGDWSNSCGGGGFYMSAMEMARFMAYLSHTYTLLDKDQRDLMDNTLLGWDPGDSPVTVAGQAHGKDGALYFDSNASGSFDAGDAGLQTLIMKFPNGIDLSIVMNSVNGNWRSLSNLAKNAYNASWVD